jgi:16S rRNA (cytosine967-C5)-methyltransferase
VAETEALLAANNSPAPTVVRVNRRRADPEKVAAALAARGIATRPSAYAPDALLLEDGGDPQALPGYGEGWFALQGEASQLVAALVPTAARILDVCTAPGGKATAAAERSGEGLIVAVDRHGAGLRNLQRAAVRLGLANLVAVRADARALPLASGWRADAVLVDAPCSGLGTLRQHPEIRWRRTKEDIRSLADLQRQLLYAAAERVSLGGVLVYATCTISAAENAEVVASFLAEHPEFAIDDPRPSLPTAAHELIDADGFLRTFPHRHRLDGFFAARLKKNHR